MNFNLKYFFIYSYFFLGVCLSSCDNSSDKGKDDKNFLEKLFSKQEETSELVLDPLDYMNWCENIENGLIKTKEIGKFRFSGFYKTSDYLAISELKNDTIDLKSFTEKQKEYGDLIYFSFKIENTEQQNELLKINLENDNEYFGRLEYVSFKMQDDFKLVTGKDTVNCSLYHFERVYGLAPFATFVLGFDVKTKVNEDLKLCFHDKLFKNGIIILNFNKKTTSNIPKLKI